MSMNNLPIITSYEVKKSRTDEFVPVVNGVHLHSIYNPEKEAHSLIDSHIHALKEKNEVVILGLGFGYHVNYAIKKMQEFHGNNFRLIVIEPNHDVYKDCLDKNLIDKKNILIYSGFTARELYSDIDLIHFLLRKPAIIAHATSFNLYQLYFKDFLTFTAPTCGEGLLSFAHTIEIRKYLEQFSSGNTLEEILEAEVANKNQFASMDFLAMALHEMTKGSREIENEETK